MRHPNRTLLPLMIAGATLVAACAGMSGQRPMSFFVTSASPGKGADYGGLAGADRHCQQLAAANGAGEKTWRAYLSTQGKDGAATVICGPRVSMRVIIAESLISPICTPMSKPPPTRSGVVSRNEMSRLICGYCA